ncbi:ABC transporter substrate-binding protein [Stappia aggregata IAM 12614]|uniref:ABC transporter substrate-binding protein n=1 Tax=Roseibium aggregatum (strain ATCC 25650 / DSM 13394 / JCM 20685 / NBRC 16684 / NCIMB 2208 / IAM 12614 / B1) TaxID=384765 RepID=A0NUL3_ROSAI|nr:extracellular solute-binding protein [Roseibium aggregatum]EAV43615.1 ABC transporter substrate-binding protein [Stappia aggregata IAM 12614] [Roseibium aggregatum IAM 12614]
MVFNWHAGKRAAAALVVTSVVVMSGIGPGPAVAAEPEWHHAAALNGTPKYGADAKHFDYVNPDAPKGGTVRLSASGGFDTFNILAQKGNIAPGILNIYESLMEPSLDEEDISAQYGVLAEAVRFPDDYSWVEYRLNPDAKWHDGEPVTAEDVIWSFEKSIELDPQRKYYFQNVETAEVVGDGTVRFSFDVSGNRELPKIMGQLTVLPKHWWEGTNEKGETRDISRTTLEPPLGSGAYRIREFSPNRQVIYERVPDYWGKDLPIRVGTNNFDEIRYISFLDDSVQFEAFKGDQYDFHVERSSSQWAKRYDFPAVNDGRVVKEIFPDKSSGVMQGFFLNMRREKFQNPDVRQALNYAYDFETTNEIVSANLLKRVNSYFAGTELASSGLPQGKELEILEEVRDMVPPEVFTQEYKNPVGGNPQNVRANLREAVKLLRKAGYELKDRKMVDTKTGEQLSVEFLYRDKASERTLLPYAQNLENIGIKPVLRLVDTSQFVNRVRSRDFDTVVLAIGQSLSPGNEQREYWGSASADNESSANYAGIKNPAIDKLIDKVIFAKDRETLVAATHALDRVLLWNHYVVPQFYSDETRTARWNRFGHPQKMPEYSTGFPTIWWYDEALAAKTGAAR